MSLEEGEVVWQANKGGGTCQWEEKVCTKASSPRDFRDCECFSGIKQDTGGQGSGLEIELETRSLKALHMILRMLSFLSWREWSTLHLSACWVRHWTECSGYSNEQVIHDPCPQGAYFPAGKTAWPKYIMIHYLTITKVIKSIVIKCYREEQGMRAHPRKSNLV